MQDISVQAALTVSSSPESRKTWLFCHSLPFDYVGSGQRNDMTVTYLTERDSNMSMKGFCTNPLNVNILHLWYKSIHINHVKGCRGANTVSRDTWEDF